MNTPKRTWSLRRYLVAGVLVWLPILASLWVISFIVGMTDRILLLLPEAYRPEAIVGFRLPGLGIVIALVVLLATGLMVTNLIGRRLVQYWDGLMRRIPLVRSIHGGVKSFAESVFSTNNSFRKVVMIQYPRAGIWSIGFVTADDVAEIGEKTGVSHACVYIPTTPNPTSGFIVMVPKSEVVELEMTVDAAMKMIITCGVVMPPAPPRRPRLAQPAA
ncbi:MAG TPA: DUF502 domain-containing protein [Steroidobacteraceae bacterium]|jgi:uncharacterized membrane protein|nr:DUF502 domain-containing protein [Steroidobacteraceae bacterium]